MKYLKTYEEINQNKPEIGDYIVVKPDIFQSENYSFINKYINNTTGLIVDIEINDSAWGDIERYLVYYEKLSKKVSKMSSGISKNNKTYHFNLSIDDFQYWSKNKKELETIIAANKFNL